MQDNTYTKNSVAGSVLLNGDNSGYVTNEELISKDYITKQSVKDLYVQKALLKDFATKDYVDSEIAKIPEPTPPSNVEISASTDSANIHINVDKQPTGSDTNHKFKFKFTGLDNLVGGAGGSQSYTIISVYRTSQDNTVAPEIERDLPVLPTGWFEKIIGEGKYLWKSQGRKSADGKYIIYADLTYWSAPECCGIINGSTSETGVDTDTIDYVYWATGENAALTPPQFTVEKAKVAFKTSDSIVDYVAGQSRMWYNHPIGVTKDKNYEYCSYAKYDSENEVWGKYSDPFIFSHYGVDGKDGDGLEYIYCLTTSNEAPEISYDNYTEDQIQRDDFIPGGGWTDNPGNVDETNRYQFVSTRKKNGSTGMWGMFGKPCLWSVYVKPKDPDDPASVVVQLAYYKCGKLDEEMINIVQRKTGEIPEGWTLFMPKPTTADDYIYMINCCLIDNKIQADVDGYYWSEAARISGLPGADGTDIIGVDASDTNYVYLNTDKTIVPDKPKFTVQDMSDYNGRYELDDSNYGTVVWTDHPNGVTSECKYEWMAYAKKPRGTEEDPSPSWENYGTPVIWSAYGDRGMDGDGFEYIYKRTTAELDMDAPEAKYGDNRSDDIPDGWSDDPLGVTSEYPYEYVSTRKKQNGTWGLYNKPALWAKYSKDGRVGRGIKEVIEYYQVTENTQNAPTKWVTTIPALTNTNKFLWNYEKVMYTDETYSETSPAIIGCYGDEGRGIKAIVEMYLCTNLIEGVTKETEGWSTKIQGVSPSAIYLYNYEIVQYTDGTQHETEPVIIGRWGRDGEDGTDGVSVMMNVRKWASCNVGDKFYKGENGESQVDVVYYDNKYYRCIKTFTLTDINSQTPPIAEYWSLFESYSNIATELFLADEASIDNLLLNKAKAKNADGTVTVDIDGTTGKLTAKNAYFENSYVEGQILASTIGYNLAIPRALGFEMDTDGTLGHHIDSTWKISSIGVNIPTTAMQLLDCKQSVYVFWQIADLPNITKFKSNCGGFITYALPAPKIVGKMVLDLYFRYDKNYITDSDTYKLIFTMFLAVMDPTINKDAESTDGCYVASNYSGTSESNTLINVSSYNKISRPTAPYYMKLNKKYVSDQSDEEVDCNMPSHIKLLSDGESFWYILEVDEIF